MFVTNQLLNEKREEHCFAITPERKYYHVGSTFIKRSLRPSEWQISPFKGTIHVPRLGRERLLNEAAVLSYISQNTNIPVPTLHCSFEDDGAVYLIMEYVEGVTMDHLGDVERKVVERELEEHLTTLRSLTSTRIGGPTGLVIPPHRVLSKTPRDQWKLKLAGEDLVLCHNDLSQQNVIVDPQSLKIRAIIDWEYAGFYPAFFEKKFFERLGPSIALDGEKDDSDALLNYLRMHLVG